MLVSMVFIGFQGSFGQKLKGFHSRNIYIYICMMILSGSYNHPNHPKRTNFSTKFLLGKKSQAWNTVPTKNLPTGLAAVAVFGPSEDGLFCGYSAVDFFG